MTEPRQTGAAVVPKDVAGPPLPQEGRQGSHHAPSGSGAQHVDERRPEYCAVTCARCGAVAHAAKFSLQHTSVQWTEQAVRGCDEFAAAGVSPALIPTCASLRDSIENAVAGGRVEVLPP
jgi:hypothetical protein